MTNGEREGGTFAVQHRAAADHTDSQPPVRRAISARTLKLAAVFWLCVLITDSLLWGIAGVDPIASALGKVVLNVFGAMLTLVVTVLLFRLRAASLLLKVAVAFAFSAVAAAIYGGFDILIYLWMARPAEWQFNSTVYGHTLISSTAMFFGWSCFYVALVSNDEIRDRDQRLAIAREEAVTAQMRALRYQIHPHFLFNTINSAVGLMEEGASVRAQRMMLSLSAFLRQTLDLDPLKDVRLSEELQLQEDYLEIERERFPDRMEFTIDVEEEALVAFVPNLILQPLIENAVKHGVEPSTGKVGIRITAWRGSGQLAILVENDLPAAAKFRRPSENPIGLRNVAQRLAARFGDEASFDARQTDGRFRAEIRLPWSVS
jgi:two-component system LytT family sensor kinase